MTVNPPSTVEPISYRQVEQQPTYRALRSRHRRFVIPVTLAALVWYVGFIVAAIYAPEVMAIPVFGSVNLGIVLGLGQFVTTFAITGWYVWYANKKLDPLSDEIRDELERASETAAAHNAATGE